MSFRTFIAILLIATAIGCKKKGNAENPGVDHKIKGTLTGQWKLAKRAYDHNFNQIIDTNELDIPDDQFSATMTMNEDGTGSVVRMYKGQITDTLLFDWVRASNSKLTSKNFAVTYMPPAADIDKLTETELVLIESEYWGPGKAKLKWIFYSR